MPRFIGTPHSKRFCGPVPLGLLLSLCLALGVSIVVWVQQHKALVQWWTTQGDAHTSAAWLPSSLRMPKDRKEVDESSFREASSSKTDPSTQHPLNIVLLYADDWSFTTLGATGNKYVKTPHLDKLATQNASVLFTHACVTTSICMVSRATLYTGQYASQHQTWESYTGLNMYQGDRWRQTLYPLLKQAGYHVGFFGKYHHRHPPAGIPTFDEFRSYQGAHFRTRDNVTRHITEWNELDALEYLTQLKPKDKTKPFCLTVSFFATHAEDGSKEQYRPRNHSEAWYEDAGPVPHFPTFTPQHRQRLPYFFDRRNFGIGRSLKRYFPEAKYQHMMKNTYRMASEVDEVCGKIVAELEKQGILNETLIVFTTDNGNFHGQHGLAEKWFAYEESIRVPLIVWDPRRGPDAPPLIRDDFVLNIDLAPTLLGAAQIRVPNVMQGRDMADLYLEKPNRKGRPLPRWRNEFYYEWFNEGKHALPSNVALVRKDSKYINWTQWEYQQYFDLSIDPYEEKDIYNTTNSSAIGAIKARLWELQQLAMSGAKM